MSNELASGLPGLIEALYHANEEWHQGHHIGDDDAVNSIGLEARFDLIDCEIRSVEAESVGEIFDGDDKGYHLV